MKHTITEVFKTPAMASNAIDRLTQIGITDKDISVLMSSDSSAKDFAVEQNSKAPEGIATGAVIGGALGGIAASLTAVGSIVLTGGAGLLVAGPLVAALAGIGAGASGGGLIGGLIGLGLNENEAKHVEKELEDGSVLVAVETDGDKKNEVKKILESAKDENPLTAGNLRTGRREPAI